MKTKLAIILVIICFAFSCATIKPQPPTGCENSFLYKTSFIPLGPVVVRAGLFDLAVLVPESRPIIITGCTVAETFIQEGNLVGSLNKLIDLLVIQSRDPAVLILVMSARIALETLASMPNISTATIDACDKNILISMCQNVRSDVAVLR